MFWYVTTKFRIYTNHSAQECVTPSIKMSQMLSICDPICQNETWSKLIYVSQHIERDQLSPKIKLTFWYFQNGCSFISILVQKILKLDIAFLRYGNFIEDVMTDWWNVDFEKKALMGICTKYCYFGISEVNFYMKTLLLHQILQVT